MSTKKVMLVDLDKCSGCYACEVGCQQWYHTEEADKRVRVSVMGPVKLNGRLAQYYFPVFTASCDLCQHSPEKLPFCVKLCPVKALSYCDEELAVQKVSSDSKIQIGKVI